MKNIIVDGNVPEKAMPEVATTQVWITVFSCLVKGCFKIPDLSRNLVHVFTKKKPNNPADTFNDGIIPVVRLSFITINVNKIPRIKLTTNARTVSCCFHAGTFLLSNILSIDDSIESVVFRLASSSFSTTLDDVRSIDIIVADTKIFKWWLGRFLYWKLKWVTSLSFLVSVYLCGLYSGRNWNWNWNGGMESLSVSKWQQGCGDVWNPGLLGYCLEGL